MRTWARTILSVRTRGELGAGLLCLMVAMAPALTWGFESDHDTITLLWNDHGADCDPVEMELTADFLWSGTALLPGPDAAGSHPLVYFQFMVDGSMANAHYGQDLLREDGVVLAANPVSIVVELNGYGYIHFQLDEASLTYAVDGAPGAMLAEITYENLPEPVPDELKEATRVLVENSDTADDLGFYFYDLATDLLPVIHLLPLQNYVLRFEAPGFRTTEVELFLPDTSPLIIQGTLQELVATNSASWGEIKALYR